jgi:endoglucanase
MRSEDDIKDLLRRLTLAAGAPGAEDEVRSIVRESIGSAGEISHDRLGSILCEKPGSAESPRISLDGHLDEVGFMIQSISKEGRLNFLALGGWWAHVLLGQRVDIVTDEGKIPGVIGCKPPHFLSKAERNRVLELENMYIDVGATSREEVAELGVRLGDTVVPHTTFVELAAKDILSSKAFDNRAGIGLMCEAMLDLGATEHPNTVIGIGAVQEEVGCRGAGTASELARPDVGIILEGTPADDIPGVREKQAILGKGPQIRLYDPTAISNRRLVRFIESVAKDSDIDIQLAVRRSGGTDAKSIHLHGSGVPTVVIGVPARYIHSHVSLIHWRDYLATREHLREVLKRLDADTVNSFTDFS